MAIVQVRGIHDSYTSPPNYPIFNGNKRQKKANNGVGELTSALTEAVKTFVEQTKAANNASLPNSETTQIDKLYLTMLTP